MKSTLQFFTIIALLTYTPTVEAQRPGGGGGGRQGGPPPGMNQNNTNLQNPEFGNQNFGNRDLANQNAANQNMPSIQQLAQMMIANFDADGSGGLEQTELQNGLTALRQMMQNQNGGNQGQASLAANAQNGLGQNAFGQNNQAGDVNAAGRPPRGPRRRNAADGGANNFRVTGRER